jgi:hypothetical protein
MRLVKSGNKYSVVLSEEILNLHAVLERAYKKGARFAAINDHTTHAAFRNLIAHILSDRKELEETNWEELAREEDPEAPKDEIAGIAKSLRAGAYLSFYKRALKVNSQFDTIITPYIKNLAKSLVYSAAGLDGRTIKLNPAEIDSVAGTAVARFFNYNEDKSFHRITSGTTFESEEQRKKRLRNKSDGGIGLEETAKRARGSTTGAFTIFSTFRPDLNMQDDVVDGLINNIKGALVSYIRTELKNLTVKNNRENALETEDASTGKTHSVHIDRDSKELFEAAEAAMVPFTDVFESAWGELEKAYSSAVKKYRETGDPVYETRRKALEKHVTDEAYEKLMELAEKADDKTKRLNVQAKALKAQGKGEEEIATLLDNEQEELYGLKMYILGEIYKIKSNVAKTEAGAQPVAPRRLPVEMPSNLPTDEEFSPQQTVSGGELGNIVPVDAAPRNVAPKNTPKKQDRDEIESDMYAIRRKIDSLAPHLFRAGRITGGAKTIHPETVLPPRQKDKTSTFSGYTHGHSKLRNEITIGIDLPEHIEEVVNELAHHEMVSDRQKEALASYYLSKIFMFTQLMMSYQRTTNIPAKSFDRWFREGVAKYVGDGRSLGDFGDVLLQNGLDISEIETVCRDLRQRIHERVRMTDTDFAYQSLYQPYKTFSAQIRLSAYHHAKQNVAPDTEWGELTPQDANSIAEKAWEVLYGDTLSRTYHVRQPAGTNYEFRELNSSTHEPQEYLPMMVEEVNALIQGKKNDEWVEQYDPSRHTLLKGAEVVRKLVRLAEYFDRRGFFKRANEVDQRLRFYAHE